MQSHPIDTGKTLKFELLLGTTTKTKEDLEEEIDRLRKDHYQDAYNVMDLNCIEFTDDLSRFLCNKKIPKKYLRTIYTLGKTIYLSVSCLFDLFVYIIPHFYEDIATAQQVFLPRFLFFLAKCILQMHLVLIVGVKVYEREREIVKTWQVVLVQNLLLMFVYTIRLEVVYGSFSMIMIIVYTMPMYYGILLYIFVMLRGYIPVTMDYYEDSFSRSCKLITVGKSGTFPMKRRVDFMCVGEFSLVYNIYPFMVIMSAIIFVGMIIWKYMGYENVL